MTRSYCTKTVLVAVAVAAAVVVAVGGVVGVAAGGGVGLLPGDRTDAGRGEFTCDVRPQSTFIKA